MKAIMFDMRLWKVGLKFLKLAPKFFLLHYRDDWPAPPLASPTQLRIRNSLAGLCASDLHQYSLNVSMYQSILASPRKIFPMGHEVVGTVEALGDQVQNFAVGDRVVYYPLATCESYGLPLCPMCQSGDYHFCICLTGAHPAIAPHADLNAELEAEHFGGFGGGGFSESLVGYPNQFFKVPTAVPDEVAVLTEPFSIALHAVLRHPPKPNEQVVVVGGGIIGLLVVAALRCLGFHNPISAIIKYEYQAVHAQNLGADHVVFVDKKGGHYQDIAELVGGTLQRPMFSKPVLYGTAGIDLVYDCVASEQSMDDNLRLVRCGGKVIAVGMGYTVTKKVDWSLQTHKEITVVGSFLQSLEPLGDTQQHAFTVALDLMEARADLFQGLVTHRFGIQDYKAAFRLAEHKRTGAAVKIVFDYSPKG